MKICILLTVTANFFNLIHHSIQQCTTKTECIPPNQNAGTPIEIGIIYDVYENNSSYKQIVALDAVACEVISKFGDSLTFKRYPGATVTTAGDGIKCSDDCFRNREDACRGVLNPEYFTKCGSLGVHKPHLEQCVNNKESDAILAANGDLRCKMGIPKSKIPALIFNQVYDPCQDFSSAEQLTTFLCSTFGKALTGKGCQ